MKTITPQKLQPGDEIRVIAPSLSLRIISDETRNYANKNIGKLELNISFGKNTELCDEFNSSSLDARIEDLHDAFEDKNVKAIIAVIGGSNCNQLLRYVDWQIIKNSPKIFCGYSDTTALQNAIFAKTGLITYSGPAYSTLGQKYLDTFTLDSIRDCLFNNDPYSLQPSKVWTDDPWYRNQEDRKYIKNNNFWALSEGEAKGTIIGGNLCTLNLLQGTDYMPSAEEIILFIEDDGETKASTFDRNLQSLIHTITVGPRISGVVIGRFKKESNIDIEILKKMLLTKFDGIPIVANVDFGHTDPKITFPIGGVAELTVTNKKQDIKISVH